MAQFRKKPVVVEAWQITKPTTVFKITPRLISLGARATVIKDGRKIAGIHIKTLEGTMFASVGDWIIRGVAGEFYPCKPDIFEQTYEPV